MQKIVLYLTLFLLFTFCYSICREFETIGALHPKNPIQKIALKHLDLIRETFGFLTPTGVARALAFYSTCMYDTFALYDEKANPWLVTKDCKKNAKEGEITKAISFAAYHCIKDIFANHPMQLKELKEFYENTLGYKKVDEDMSDSAQTAKMVAMTVIEYYHRDGMNQLGDEPGTSGGKVYSDYTNYHPVNDPQPSVSRTDCSKLRNINRWQPLRVPTKTGGEVIQVFSTPQMGRVKPFALENAAAIRPGPPPLYGTNTQDEYVKQFKEVLDFSGQMDDITKTIAEFWADGPDSTLPPGHWHKIAVEASIARNLGIADTIKLLFAQGHAVSDAGIAVWDAKRYYDSGRPATTIPCLWGNQMVKAWMGPYKGVGMINGSDWQPYQDPYFVTPPFSEYVSGHSGFSGSSAEILKQFFNGDDTYIGPTYILRAGCSMFEPKIMCNEPGHIPGYTDVPNNGPMTRGYSPARDIKLEWDTWTEAALEAGMSRLYGGIHIKAGNEEGMTIGRKAGKAVWEKAMKLFNGENCK